MKSLFLLNKYFEPLQGAFKNGNLKQAPKFVFDPENTERRPFLAPITGGH
jgi:hypothetical protein